MTDQSHRSYGVDALRAVTALVVVIFHFTNGQPQFLPDGNALKVVSSFGFLGVAAFFVISGFVIPYSMDRMSYRFPRDVKAFAMRRFFRIYPAYVCSVAITIALLFASSMLPISNVSPPTITLAMIVGHMTYLAPWISADWLSPIYWSLAIEVQFYVAMIFCAPLLLQTNKLILNAALFAIAFLAFAPVDKTVLLWYSPLFGIGITYFLGRTGRLTMIEASAQALGFVIVAWITMDRYQAITGALVYLLLLVPVKRPIPLVGMLSAISYSLYLLHAQTGGRIINLAMRLPHTSSVQFMAIAIAFVVSIAAAYLLWRCVEKPSIAFKRRQRPSTTAIDCCRERAEFINDAPNVH